MIYNVNYGDGNRKNIIEYLKKNKKENKDYTVIDIGGTYEGWSWPVVDCLIDINKCPDDSIKQFQFNICDNNNWDTVLEHVKENGKFDFAICTHTLEDISSPKMVCEKISQIAKEGYIAIPSKFIELSRLGSVGFEATINNKSFRGYIHHRWIFQIEDNKFVGYPKLNFIEIDDFFDKIANRDMKIRDLNFMWKDKLELNIVNDDFMGPGSQEVIQMFRKGLSKKV